MADVSLDHAISSSVVWCGVVCGVMRVTLASVFCFLLMIRRPSAIVDDVVTCDVHHVTIRVNI